MHLATTRNLAELLNVREPPCVSLYQPTDRASPGNRQNPVRFKNHLRDIEATLRRKYPAREIRPLMEKFERLADDSQFWMHRSDGLAVLAGGDAFEVFDLPRRVQERVVVADSFHLKPLLRFVQSADRFQLLCVTRHSAKLYEGNRDALEPVAPSKVPATVVEALGEGWTGPRQTVPTEDGGERRTEMGDQARYVGSGDMINQFDKVTDRFFRAIDAAVLEHHSRPSGLPLILAAMAETQPAFRDVTKNNFLMPQGLTLNPETTSLDELRRQAWTLMEPHYVARLGRMIDTFHASKPRNLASDDLNDVVKAAVIGRIGMLLIEADRHQPGRIDATTGALQLGGDADAQLDDVFDDLAELALRNGAEVVVVPSERMPTNTGLAATYRF
jgi:hypothetical protein